MSESDKRMEAGLSCQSTTSAPYLLSPHGSDIQTNNLQASYIQTLPISSSSSGGLIFPKIDKHGSDTDVSDYYESDTEEDTDEKINVIADNLTEDYENELEKHLSKDFKRRKRRQTEGDWKSECDGKSERDTHPSTSHTEQHHMEEEPQGETESVVEKGRSRSSGLRRPASKIPLHLKGLMGQANIMFAQGNYGLAEKMCYEIIRQVPLAPEPYLTLAQLYETTHSAKSIQYLTIAAHLEPNNTYQWVRLADIHLDSNNMKQAVTCYTKAIAGDPSNIELHYKRLDLLERLNDNRFIQRCKVRLLNTLKSKHHHLMLPLAKEITEKYHRDNEHQKAIEAMYVPFNKCSDKITPDLVNIMLELLLMTKSYSNCLDIFVQFCNIEIEIVIDDANVIHILSFTMPNEILIDLRIKFIICMIKLEAFDLLDALLAPLLTDENVESIGDLYLDVAEALMVGNRHGDALKLLIPLVKSRNFSLAAVWLKHAECLKCCDMIEQAVESYYTVMRMAPQHMDVRHALGELLLNTGKAEEALKVFTQDPNANEIDVALVMKKIKLLQEFGRYEEYYNSILFMLTRHCITLKHFEEISDVIHLERVKEIIGRINTQRLLRGEEIHEHFPISLREPPVVEEYTIVKEAMQTAYKRRDFLYLQKISIHSLCSNRFKTQTNDLVIAAFYGFLLDNSTFYAYTLSREILLRNLENQIAWNFFNLIMQNLDETRHSRFLMRLSRNHENRNINYLLANYALSTTNTKLAMMHMVSLLEKEPTPLNHLNMAMIFIQFIQKKKLPLNVKKIMQIIYGFMLSYANLRSKDAQHEVYYNMGRLYHHFGMLHLAADYYEKALAFNNRFIEENLDTVCLKHEAAFNLHLIYKNSGNVIAARNVIIKYLTI